MTRKVFLAGIALGMLVGMGVTAVFWNGPYVRRALAQREAPPEIPPSIEREPVPPSRLIPGRAMPGLPTGPRSPFERDALPPQPGDSNPETVHPDNANLPSIGVGRYQISAWAHAGSAGINVASHGAYVIDTQTGEVWAVGNGKKPELVGTVSRSGAPDGAPVGVPAN